MISETVTCLLSLALCTAASPPQITRVETGLLPPVTMLGEPTRTMTMSERMAHYKASAVSIAVIENNRILWSRAWGTQSKGGKLATAETLFQAGSISKPIAASGALMLAHEGKLSLDRPVNDYLTSWKIPPSDKAEGKPVTLHGILSHSAGLSTSGFRGYAKGLKVPSLVAILDGASPEGLPEQPVRIVQKPGSAWRYSGGGYVVAQQMIEDVTGRPFAQVMHSKVLQPLGMTDSSFAQPLPENRAWRAAVGHTSDGDQTPGRWNTVPEMAAGGLWTTPTDLARFAVWVMAGLKNGAAREHSFVARHLVDPQIDASDARKMGLGLFTQGEGPTLRFLHPGAQWGHRAYMIGFPETGQGAVVMVNSDASNPLLLEVLRSLAAEYRWPERFHRMVQPADVSQKALDALAGTYEFQSREDKNRMVTINVRSTEGALLVVLPDGPTTYRFRPETQTNFLDAETGRTLIFDEPGSLRWPQLRITAKRK